MAIPKICGVETEYGIVHRGVAESNPIAASSFLINSYIAEVFDRDMPGPALNVSWNFEDEMPGNDARGFAPIGSMAPMVETHLVNAVLTNGARYYVDHAHPELSTPECADARSIVQYDRAAELIAVESMAAAMDRLPGTEEIVLYKNNSDGKGNSYGFHENYLMDRDTPFARIVTNATAHFVTRQIFTGSGKVGCEIPGLSSREVPFQLTQRADFFEEEVGLETTLKRPIINTRDEPHADAHRYRRLHVIAGDANMSEVATFLKVGTTCFVLAMVEDDWISTDLTFKTPVASMRAVSHDVTLRQSIRMDNDTSMTALEVQWELLGLASSWAENHDPEIVGGQEVAEEILRRWEQILTGLESDPDSLSKQLDWVAKKQLIEQYCERNDIGWDDARVRVIDLQYHDLRPKKSLFARLDMEKLISDDDAIHAKSEPPEDTRAYFRGRCLQKFTDEIVAANWDSLVFDVGDEPLRRVPMMEPARGTREHVGSLLDECETARDLLSRLNRP